MRVEITEFDERGEEILSIREKVFEEEQGVSRELEWDGLDPDCIHVVAFDDNDHSIGTGRLLRSGKIGRMAVLEGWRGKGVGRALLTTLLKAATTMPLEKLVLDAQINARPFYEKFGFEAVGGEFMEAGIMHIEMQRAFRQTVDRNGYETSGSSSRLGPRPEGIKWSARVSPASK